MTITERNQKLYELRESLCKARNEVAWIETQIMAVRQQYKDEQLGDLYEEMFATKWYPGRLPDQLADCPPSPPDCAPDPLQ